MDENQHIALLEETAATIRRMRTDEALFLNGSLEIIESTDGELFVPHRIGTAFVGKFLRVQVARRVLSRDSIRAGTMIRMADGVARAQDSGYYPLHMIYEDGVCIASNSPQVSAINRFLTWRQLADDWEMFACPPWDFWQPCYESSPNPVEEAIALQGVGPRRVNLEDAPVSPAMDVGREVPF